MPSCVMRLGRSAIERPLATSNGHKADTTNVGRFEGGEHGAAVLGGLVGKAPAQCHRGVQNERRRQLVLMPFMDQVSNANFLSQCEPVFGRELQHVLHGPASHVVFSEDLVALSQRLEGAGNHLLGGVVAARTEVPLNQALAVRIEMNLANSRFQYAGSCGSLPGNAANPSSSIFRAAFLESPFQFVGFFRRPTPSPSLRITGSAAFNRIGGCANYETKPISSISFGCYPLPTKSHP